MILAGHMRRDSCQAYEVYDCWTQRRRILISSLENGLSMTYNDDTYEGKSRESRSMGYLEKIEFAAFCLRHGRARVVIAPEVYLDLSYQRHPSL